MKRWRIDPHGTTLMRVTVTTPPGTGRPYEAEQLLTTELAASRAGLARAIRMAREHARLMRKAKREAWAPK